MTPCKDFPLPQGEGQGEGIGPKIRASSLYWGRGSELPRKLRQSSTDPEIILWRHLRGNQLAGIKFRRQQALGPYIVDFYAHEFRLIIEIDGGQHFEPAAMEKDRERTEWLESCGFRLLRFTNLEVFKQRESVLERILLEIEPGRPHPNPLPKGEGIGSCSGPTNS